MPRGAELALENIPIPHPATPEQVHAARLAVCAAAHNKEEATEMLKMLGLF